VRTKLRKPFGVPMDRARSGFGSLQYNDKIYVVGGNNGAIIKKFSCLDLKSNKWINLSDMKIKREDLAFVLGSDHGMYAIGGSS
jgi:influenza virus NS1A-binding protein